MPKYNEHSVDNGTTESQVLKECIHRLESVIEICKDMQELTKYREIEISPAINQISDAQGLNKTWRETLHAPPLS